MKIPLKVPPLGTPIRCDWNDSVDAPGWQYIFAGESLKAPLRPPMQTRGVLVAHDDSSLAIAPTIAPRGPDDLKTGYLDVLTIPLGAIVSIRMIP